MGGARPPSMGPGDPRQRAQRWGCAGKGQPAVWGPARPANERKWPPAAAGTSLNGGCQSASSAPLSSVRGSPIGTAGAGRCPQPEGSPRTLCLPLSARSDTILSSRNTRCDLPVSGVTLWVLLCGRLCPRSSLSLMTATHPAAALPEHLLGARHSACVGDMEMNWPPWARRWAVGQKARHRLGPRDGRAVAFLSLCAGHLELGPVPAPGPHGPDWHGCPV